MKTHRHNKCVEHAFSQAESLCEENNIRLTPIRQKVLEIVWRSHEPIKAYDILEKLGSSVGSQKPPTVYRALDFLLEYGFIHRIESLSAFVGCIHPEHQHACQLFICNQCHEVQESCDNEVLKRIEKNAHKAHFSITKTTVEVFGLCAKCVKEERV